MSSVSTVGTQPLAKLAGMSAPSMNIKDFDDMTKSFFPSIQLAQDLTKYVKLRQLESGDFFVNKRSLIERIGNTATVTPIDVRMVAIDSGTTVKFVYDIESADYKDIVARSATPNSGCFFGPEFLVWVKDIGFCSLLCGSKSARISSQDLFRCMLTTVQLQSKDFENKKKQTWKIFVVEPAEEDQSVPTLEECEAAKEKFKSFMGAMDDAGEAGAAPGRE